MSEVINYLLSKLDLHPILVDIGASGAPPEIWGKIARHSIYVGFDADLRGIHEVSGGHFYKALIFNQAATSDEGKGEVQFYLTKSPSCSSTLKPDAQSLANFLFSDLFVIEKEVIVPATSLDSVMGRLSLPGVHWFKTDSQGTDLRLFNSLKDEVRNRVLAVDIEPGLIDAYVGEDLFVDAHRYLTRHGFWLSNLNVQGTIRMRRSTLREVITLNRHINPSLVERTVRKSPGWCEARYFRTIESMNQGSFAKNDYVLLWVFAMIDNQLGFALDLAIEHEKVFGADDISQSMKDEPILCIMKLGRNRALFATLKSILPRQVRRWLGKYIL